MRYTPEGEARPEFILVIPVQSYESHHEWTLPAETFRRLVDGSLGYVEALHLEPRTLFDERPMSFVNPPVRVFVRKDRAGP
ncbi:MAG: hypothetical protein ACREQ9_09535 [Candidatus Binatia bacterium]